MKLLKLSDIRKRNKALTSEPGSRFKTVYHGEVQDNGIIKLIADDVIDIQEKMNAERASCSIENILAMAEPGEDFTDDGKSGFDATNVPKTLAEFMQIQIDKKREFDALPVKIKEKFMNDFNRYLATAGSEEWFEKLGINIEDQKPKEEEVKQKNE